MNLREEGSISFDARQQSISTCIWAREPSSKVSQFNYHQIWSEKSENELLLVSSTIPLTTLPTESLVVSIEEFELMGVH